MKTPKRNDKTAGISDDAVQKATGKTWPQWASILDQAGAKKMNHKEIVAVVCDQCGVGPWWQQMVTVGYEQARGLREKHETATGYQVSRSKTFVVPVSAAFKAWKDKRLRDRWLAEPLTIRKATANKSLRFTWADGKTNVEVNFYPKGDGKTQVTVQHNKLPNGQAAARMKKYWGQALTRLAQSL